MSDATDFVDDLIALCRCFGMFERDQVCCGTVTVQQCVVLQALRDGPSEVSPLADSVGRSPSAMTRLVDGLVSRGWIDRSRDASDRRRVQVQLTESGREEADRLRGLTVGAIDAVMAGIPEEKRPQVMESVRLVREAMSGAREAIEDCCG
ncbi:MAG: DNA-binding MarR family transcriptional regulator [Myxococcota bacterium]|jgi:DNA-binding MarR family transcriptional regulator